LNKGCTCAAGRVERRDADDVAVCAKAARAATQPAAATAMGTLEIGTKGTITVGASWADPVLIDGRPMGATPITTKVPAGNHVITFSRAKTTNRKSVTVPVKANETTKVMLDLE